MSIPLKISAVLKKRAAIVKEERNCHVTKRNNNNEGRIQKRKDGLWEDCQAAELILKLVNDLSRMPLPRHKRGGMGAPASSPLLSTR